VDYASHPKLVEAVRLVGESYWQAKVGKVEPSVAPTRHGPQANDPARTESYRRRYASCLDKFEMVIQKFPEDATNTPLAYHMAGECYASFGEYQKTLDYFEKVCQTWPGYEFAWHLNYMVGDLCKQLVASKAMSKSDADALTAAAHKRLLELYPNSPAAKAVRPKSNTNSSAATGAQGGLQ
jgi:TolA-binding protein